MPYSCCGFMLNLSATIGDQSLVQVLYNPRDPRGLSGIMKCWSRSAPYIMHIPFDLNADLSIEADPEDGIIPLPPLVAVEVKNAGPVVPPFYQTS